MIKSLVFLVNRKSAICVLMVAISGCSQTPSISVQDPMIDETTRRLVTDSVWVLAPVDARRFDDPSWPTPLQIVAPEREGNAIDGNYSVFLFGSRPSGRNIDVLFVDDGSSVECRALLDTFGLTASEAAIFETENSNQYIQCGSVLIGVPSDTRNPFADGYRTVEIVSRDRKPVYDHFIIRYRR
jgi:hypothetical protein